MHAMSSSQVLAGSAPELAGADEVKRGVAYTPIVATEHGPLAQRSAQLIVDQKVTGSNPVGIATWV